MPNLPPGPRAPALLQTLRFVRGALAFTTECAARYGDPFTVRIAGFGTTVFTSEPAALKQIFMDGGNLSGGQALKATAPLVGNTALVTLDGKAHQRLRRVMTPPFHGERMRAYGSTIASLARSICSRWEVGQTISIWEEMRDLALGVILEAVFGVHDVERLEAFRTAVARLFDVYNPALQMFALGRWDLGPFSPGGRFLRRRATLDNLIYEEIANRRDATEGKEDVLSLLMNAADEDGEKLTDVELRDQLVTLLMAGHETTATSLAWAVIWLLRTPQALERLRAELGDSPLEDLGRTASSPYLTAVCQESLRIIPTIAFVVRAVREPFEVAGYTLPENTLIAPAISLTHRRPELYPEPETFRPERFLERKFSPYEFAPFGGGVRHCLGWALTMYEMKLALAEIVSRVELEVADEDPLVPEYVGAVVRPHRGGRVKVARRLDPPRAQA